jgi:hypothetical protein
LFKVGFFIAVIILLIIGFSIGYFAKDKSWEINPLVYGIKELNKLNNDEFTCNCYSNSGEISPFLFNKEGFVNVEILKG